VDLFFEASGRIGVEALVSEKLGYLQELAMLHTMSLVLWFCSWNKSPATE
jgi:hypothetical protein